MSEKNNVISPELWAPLEQEEKNAEKMERPSLTFLQDGWRRLKSNKCMDIGICSYAGYNC